MSSFDYLGSTFSAGTPTSTSFGSASSIPSTTGAYGTYPGATPTGFGTPAYTGVPAATGYGVPATSYGAYGAPATGFPTATPTGYGQPAAYGTGYAAPTGY